MLHRRDSEYIGQMMMRMELLIGVTEQGARDRVSERQMIPKGRSPKNKRRRRIENTVYNHNNNIINTPQRHRFLFLLRTLVEPTDKTRQCISW